MGVTLGQDTWVGRGIERLEDEALLRGEGRFIDDLDPVPNAYHAAILRSPFAHARIRSIDASAALELPGVVGVLTGAEVAAMSHPFPVGVENAPASYCCASELTRYYGEPVALAVARDRYVAEDAVELISVDWEPLAAVVDAVTAAETDALVSDRSSRTATWTLHSPARTSSSRIASAFRAGAATRPSATASSRTG